VNVNYCQEALARFQTPTGWKRELAEITGQLYKLADCLKP